MDKKQLEFELVVERIKKEFLYRSDKDFAKAIGMSPTAFHNRKRTSSLPYSEIIDFANKRNVNLNWILKGEGSIYKGNDPNRCYSVENPNEIYSANHSPENEKSTSKKEDVIVVEHSDLVKDFKDQETAKEFNQYLIKIESDDPEGYKSLFDQAKTIYKTIQRLKKKDQHQNLGDNHQQNIQKKTV